MLEIEPPAALAGPGAMFSLALLHVLAETRMEMGLDADASLTFERALEAMGHIEQVTRAVTADIKPAGELRTASRSRLRAGLKRLSPILSRLVHAGRAMR